jgi:hypothetical protein
MCQRLDGPPLAGSSSGAWLVTFSDGNTVYLDVDVSNASLVRCVR